jgi:hypothetical protein
MSSTDETDIAYEALLSIATCDEGVLDLLRAIRKEGVEVDDLLDRWDREHITNSAGRIEARVYEDEPGGWIADPQTGFADPRRFESEQAAQAWIRGGGHYEHPGPRKAKEV